MTSQAMPTSSSAAGATAATTRAGTSTILSIPSTTFLLVLCPYLGPCDVLQLRRTCHRIKELLHDEQYSDEFWRILLQQHFLITPKSCDGGDILTTVNISPLPSSPSASSTESNVIPSIFGIHPGSTSATKYASSPFEAWKYWIKCSRRFYARERSGIQNQAGAAGGTTTTTAIHQPPVDRPLKQLIDEIHLQNYGKVQRVPLLINGPYFLRALKFWKQIFHWLDDTSNDNTENSYIGSRIKEQINSHRGMFYQSWSDVKDEIGLRACQAVYAFCGAPEAFSIMTGGESSREHFERVFDGLLGGYQAYNFYSCTHLIRPRSLPSDRMIVATDPLTMSTGVKKMFCVNCNTGMVELHYGRSGIVPAIHDRVFKERAAAAATRESGSSSSNSDNDSSPPSSLTSSSWDAFLIWLEEYAHRLTTGRIGVGPMGSTPHDHQSILLYPRIPTTGSMSTSNNAEEIQAVSRAVTRGVEVIASAVYLPQAMTSHFGFIYNFRIRLLTPNDDGYQSPAERGFETCQLMSRHWKIFNSETEHTDHVDGEGVIGMYPILREGGYHDDGVSFDGTFSYTSCTGPMQGNFSGHLQFVPGTINEPTGSPFPVEVKPFALDMHPSFLY